MPRVLVVRLGALWRVSLAVRVILRLPLVESVIVIIVRIVLGLGSVIDERAGRGVTHLVLHVVRVVAFDAAKRCIAARVHAIEETAAACSATACIACLSTTRARRALAVRAMRALGVVTPAVSAVLEVASDAKLLAPAEAIGALHDIERVAARWARKRRARKQIRSMNAVDSVAPPSLQPAIPHEN